MCTWSGEGLDVILVTHNATAEVREVVDRLYRFTRTPFQLYIVDNESEPETLEYLRSVETAHDNVRVLPQAENLFVGPDEQRNRSGPCADRRLSRSREGRHR